jgi:hypothetical protein
MFASSRDEVIPRKKATKGAHKVMVTTFFSCLYLITLKAPQSGTQFNQKYFIDEILLGIVDERRQIFRRIPRGIFYVHLDNSICHNSQIVTDELVIKMLERVLRPAYSPDLSPCDFWLFGMLKQKVTDRVFRTVEEILITIRKIWSEVTLGQLQSVFSNSIKRLGYVITHNGEYYAK